MAGTAAPLVRARETAADARPQHRDAGGLSADAQAATGRSEGRGRLRGWRAERRTAQVRARAGPGRGHLRSGQHPCRQDRRRAADPERYGLRLCCLLHKEASTVSPAPAGAAASGTHRLRGRIRADLPHAGVVDRHGMGRPDDVRSVPAHVLAQLLQRQRVCL